MKEMQQTYIFGDEVSGTCVGGANVGETTIQHRFIFLNHKIALTF
ncbi:hypothetical protein [Peribacillus frigoritolerans]|nr:hypothetical protein [Peribacillus frigoritolerans]